MAGLFIWHESHRYNPNLINKSFKSLDYKSGKYFNHSGWNILVYPKVSYNIQNYFECTNGFICGVGTYSYKGNVYEKALPLIFQDIKNNKLDLTGFWGGFIVLVIYKGRLTIIRDGACLTRLYSYDDLVFSTSFAGMIECLGRKLTLDKDAVTELLSTGVMTGSRTLLKEINFVNSEQTLESINLIETSTKRYPNPKNRDESLHQQIDIAKEFFKGVTDNWLNYMPDSLFDIGMTGGMDSRLLASLVFSQNYIKDRVVLHTHWRKEKHKNSDYRYAHIFANSTNTPIHTKEVLSSLDMNETQLKDNYEQAYRLSDGEIRPGCYWDEGYSTYSYRSELTKRPYLRLLGFGGEQYRNHERIPLKSNRNLKNWVIWEMIYMFAGWNFISKNQGYRIVNQIENNLKETLGDDEFNLFNFKNYIRLIQSPSYRALQAHMENKIGFCLNPFLDTHLSLSSILAIPYLGKSLDFQLDMIRIISPEMARIPNDYGFDFSKGEPLINKIGSIFWQSTPPHIKFPIYSKYNRIYNSNYIPTLSKKFGFVKELEEYILQLDLPINFSKYRLVKTRSKLMLNLGYFVKRNQQFLKL